MIYLITLNNFVNFKHINPPNGGFFIAYSLLVFLKITKHKQQIQNINKVFLGHIKNQNEYIIELLEKLTNEGENA